MKRLLIILFFAAVSMTAMAQVSDSSCVPVIRIGNTYRVGDQFMNKKAFMGYLQSRDAISYQSFRSAYRLSNVGWGLFGGGLALSVGGFGVILASSVNAATTPKADEKTVTSAALGGYTMMIIGDLTTISGIVCISLGYVRMHSTADSYNAYYGNRRQSTSVGINACLQTSSDGVGLALKF